MFNLNERAVCILFVISIYVVCGVGKLFWKIKTRALYTVVKVRVVVVVVTFRRGCARMPCTSVLQRRHNSAATGMLFTSQPRWVTEPLTSDFIPHIGFYPPSQSSAPPHKSLTPSTFVVSSKL